MITEKDLNEAIAECQGQRNPNANTCIKLAAFYTIKNELFGQRETSVETIPAMSYAKGPAGNVINHKSGTEFADAINGRDIEDILPIMDELVQAVSVMNPRLYANFIRKLTD